MSKLAVVKKEVVKQVEAETVQVFVALYFNGDFPYAQCATSHQDLARAIGRGKQPEKILEVTMPKPVRRKIEIVKVA